MSETTNMKWYVLRAISGKETKAKEYIEAEMRNSDLGDFVSQIIIPTEKVYIVRNGKKTTKERSCMPGYMLIEANLVGEIAHRLRNVPNIIGFLEEKSHAPIPVRQSEVNRILGSMDDLEELGEEILSPYYLGETVKVNYGPFTGFSGVITEVSNEKKKLKVEVSIFGRKSPLELSFTQVERE
jgi:transcriptional antiterminator NusG